MPGKVVEDTGVHSKVISRPKAKAPVLVCGLPGSGYVGKLGADHLVSVFKAKKVIEYECDSFPPQVNVKEDGTAAPLSAELYHAKTGQSKDLLIFTADAQPTTSDGEYRLAEAVINDAKSFGAKRVFTLAAYITGAFSKSPKVYGAATSKELLKLLKENGVILMKEGGITGMNGLIVGMGSLLGLPGAALLGETSGYVIDAGASQAVLESLSKLLKIRIDMSSLKEKAEETEKVITQLKSMADQSREQPMPTRRETRPGYIS
jgi:uncharacterized protein (TIGR00162 family)